MIYEWDDEKSDATWRDRRFDFTLMLDFDWTVAAGPQIQYVDGEEREVWTGPIAGKLYTTVVTHRSGAIRVISLRIATQPEIRRWREGFYHG